MTPEERRALIESTLVIWDLLASYGNTGAGELAAALRADGPVLDDALVIRTVDKVLRASAHELATMGHTLAAAVEMGSDYGAAFQAVQAEAATHKKSKASERWRTRAEALRAEGKSSARIAQIMALEVEDAKGRLVYSQDKPLSVRQVQRWLAHGKRDATT